MTTHNRVPVCVDFTFKEMRLWFAELAEAGLLFHPDDDPCEVASIVDGSRTFSDAEVRKLRKLLNQMFLNNGDKVYDAAYPAFMSSMTVSHGS